jgi:hypothetical protein
MRRLTEPMPPPAPACGRSGGLAACSGRCGTRSTATAGTGSAREPQSTQGKQQDRWHQPECTTIRSRCIRRLVRARGGRCVCRHERGHGDRHRNRADHADLHGVDRIGVGQHGSDGWQMELPECPPWRSGHGPIVRGRSGCSLPVLIQQAGSACGRHQASVVGARSRNKSEAAQREVVLGIRLALGGSLGRWHRRCRSRRDDQGLPSHLQGRCMGGTLGAHHTQTGQDQRQRRDQAPRARGSGMNELANTHGWCCRRALGERCKVQQVAFCAFCHALSAQLASSGNSVMAEG